MGDVKMVTITLTDEEAKMLKLICCDYFNEEDWDNLDVSDNEITAFNQASEKISLAVSELPDDEEVDEFEAYDREFKDQWGTRPEDI